MKKIRVLMVVEGMGAGGIETYVRGICGKINKRTFDISVLIVDSYNKGLPEDTDTLEDVGIKLFLVDRKNYLMDSIQYFKNVDVVHFQVQFLWLMILGKLLNKKVILHSHFGFENTKASTLKTWLLRRVSDLRIAPSAKAGKWLFDKDFLVVSNGINIQSYLFDETERKNMRKQLNIKDDDKVILQVGRFCENKNQLFSTQVLGELRRKAKNFKLVMVGQQPSSNYVENIRNMADKLDISKESLIVLPPEHNMSRLYSAADVLVQPSLYQEGLPYAVLEAQVNGICCLVSNTVTREVDISGRVAFLPIDKDAEQWADTIISMDLERADMRRVAAESQCNIKNVIKEIERLYTEVANG